MSCHHPHSSLAIFDRIKYFLIFILFYPSITFGFLCPNNFNQINFGDTITQVQSQCGTPTKQETKEVASEAPVPQEWSYYIPRTYVLSATNQPQMTLKTQIVFDDTGKAINISVNGLSVPSTTVCGNTIQVGSSQDAIKAACGDPGFVNKQQPTSSSGAQTQKIKITELTYATIPPVTLVFENGILKGKK